MTPTTKTHPLILTTALLLLAMPVRPVQDDDLTKLTRALEMLARTEVSGETKEEKSLGSDAVTPEWIMATHPGILTVLDAEKRLYQIKVLGQTGQECSLHSMRNCFYLLKLFTSPRADFDAIYNQMRNEESYKKFMWKELYGLDPDVIQEKVALGALPAGSQDMRERISGLDYYNERVVKKLSGEAENPSSKAQYDFAQKVKKFIHNIEPGLNDPLAIAGTVAVGNKLSGIGILLDPFSALAEKQNDSLAVQLTIPTVYSHCNTLLVTKQDGILSFIFADSLGSGWITEAMPAINIVVDFANSPERLENAFIRAVYFRNLKADGSIKTFSIFLGDFEMSLERLMGSIAITRLKQNTLFKTIYYKAFKKLWEEAKTKKGKIDDDDRELVTKIEKLLQDLDPSKG